MCLEQAAELQGQYTAAAVVWLLGRADGHDDLAKRRWETISLAVANEPLFQFDLACFHQNHLHLR